MRSLIPSRRALRFIIAVAIILTFLHIFQLPSTSHLLDVEDLSPSRYEQLKSNIKVTSSSYDWSALTPHNPVSSQIPLPTGKPLSLPRIQFDFPADRPKDSVSKERQAAVRKAFQKCWNNYKQFAWMRDELTPLSGGAKDTFGGWAATMIDSLDTLWIMDLKADFYQAVEATAGLDWDKTKDTAANVFETTIRYLGGLLSAYDLSKHPALLAKAKELGDMLYAAFDTPNRMPPFWLDFDKAKNGRLLAGTHEPSASSGSLSMEFTRLAQITGDSKYYDAIARVTNLLERTQNATKLPGMWPTFFNLRDEELTNEASFTLGALADSLYEYLPKTYALLGGLEPLYENLYKKAIKPIEKHLLFRPMLPKNEDILFSGTARVISGDIRLDPEVQHLGCFLGGMFALGGRLFENEDHVEIGAKLAKGCIYAYDAFPSGIMPEIFNMIPCDSRDSCEWSEDTWEKEGNERLPQGFKSIRDTYYILRPEAIESVFLLYRMTGRKEYQDAAWRMFQAIMAATETKYGNAAIDDVTIKESTKRNSMESFWLAETLKYFYLIFSPPDLISLDEYVFNTEAHPLLRPT